MKLKSIRIQNYRGYKDSTVNFDNLNCIVGKNDVGKTTILKAIQLLINNIEVTEYDYHGKIENYENEPIKLIGKFEICDSDNKENKLLPISDNKILTLQKTIIGKNNKKFDWFTYIFIEKSKTMIQIPNNGFIDKEVGISDSKIIIISNISKKEIVIEEKHYLVPIEYLKGDKIDIYGCLPKIKFLQTDDTIESLQKKYIEKKLSDNLKDLTSKIDDLKIKEYKFTNTELFINTDIITTINNEKKNKNIPLKNRGEGEQLLAKIVFFNKLVDLDSTKNIILALEEPESHLHPSAQRKLCEFIKKLANEHYQVVFTTHSPYIVKELEDVNIIMVSKEKNEVKIFNKIEKCLPYGSLNEVNYLAFGEASVEYHIELFGYIQNKLIDKYGTDSDWNSVIGKEAKKVASIDDWLKFHGIKDSFDFKHTDKIGLEKQKHTLPYCVRNQIDHPIDDNKKYDDLKIITDSIKILRTAILKNWDGVFK